MNQSQSGRQGSASLFLATTGCLVTVDELLDRARDATTTEEYDQALATVQQIVSNDDPPAIYYLQPQWTTILRKDIAGFLFNPIYIGTYDFYRVHRTA